MQFFNQITDTTVCGVYTHVFHLLEVILKLTDQP